MKVKPFNNRLLVKRLDDIEQKIGDIFVPDLVKDKKDIPKFMKVRVLDQSDEPKGIPDLRDCSIIIETGFLEEVVVDNKTYMFCPYNYVVCQLSPE
jgi:co-chaperonin GroES (HSP10)